MTTKERLKKMLTDLGMPDSQADAILKEALPKIEESRGSWSRIEWDRPSREQPEIVYTDLWWPKLRKAAQEWLAKNAPESPCHHAFD